MSGASAERFPAVPKHLQAAGKRAWATGKELWNEGRLTARDMSNWLLFCEAWDEKAHCERIAKRDGEYQMSPNGCYAQHPAIKRRKEAEQRILKYSQLFGLVPQARRKAAAVQQGVAKRSRG